MRIEHLTHSGAVPYLIQDQQYYTVLIKNHKGNWIFPKGVIDPGMTAAEIAGIEAFEEAGLVGEVIPTPIGRYIMPQWGMEYTVEMYLLKVEKILDEWEEAAWRERKLIKLSEAKAIVWKGLQPIVDQAMMALNK